MDGLAGAVLLNRFSIFGNAVTASFVVVTVVEVVIDLLDVVACIVVVFGADVMLLLAVVSCSLSCSLVVLFVVRGVSDIVVLLSFEGALAVNSPSTTAG